MSSHVLEVEEASVDVSSHFGSWYLFRSLKTCQHGKSSHPFFTPNIDPWTTVTGNQCNRNMVFQHKNGEVWVLFRRMKIGPQSSLKFIIPWFLKVSENFCCFFWFGGSWRSSLGLTSQDLVGWMGAFGLRHGHTPFIGPATQNLDAAVDLRGKRMEVLGGYGDKLCFYRLYRLGGCKYCVHVICIFP